MQLSRVLFVTIFLFIASGSAHAFGISWTFQNAMFHDGTGLTGSFTYDADIGGQDGYSNVNLVTESGSGLDGQTYTSASTFSGDQVLSAMSFDDYIGVIFSSPLTNAGGSIGIVPISSEGSIAQFLGMNWILPKRFLVSGSIVSGATINGTLGDPTELPEPMTLVMFLIGILTVLTFRRATPTASDR